ncbi:flagellar biosynthesis anti-sigma factor FlgM [Clostridium bornimense]|uniref:flagellar biosynthesis anti-sigma factor FlgM n=1 Tax=Clostridium bornimense TaxID=1216932 RepID=UPI001C0FBCE3|nr:flagellar biosynthesis anti-sigma factor FlgM [Clostridium bornimense]MBU5314811.1 flagellar biosynthesis anti-sigma factor FlgM [Clostridium bornimense]
MKIDRLTVVNIDRLYKNNTKNNIEEKEISKKGDRIEISEDAKKIRSISEDNNQYMNKDIEAIKKAINDGTYKVDTKELAKSMKDFMKGTDI